MRGVGLHGFFVCRGRGGDRVCEVGVVGEVGEVGEVGVRRAVAGV